MTIVPPQDLRSRIHELLFDLLTENPMATSSESYVQHYLEFELLRESVTPPYFLRIGINYHGQQVQHIRLDDNGVLVGWNPDGDSLATGANAKVLLAGHTIFPRSPNEQLMSDTKVGGGAIPKGKYVRIEFKVRGWLGKTKNLDGKQFEKDIDLLKNDQCDLLVVALSETAYRKWRGEGPAHQAQRRTGTSRFRRLLEDPANLVGTELFAGSLTFERQKWSRSVQRVVGGPNSSMPGAENFVSLMWRR